MFASHWICGAAKNISRGWPFPNKRFRRKIFLLNLLTDNHLRFIFLQRYSSITIHSLEYIYTKRNHKSITSPSSPILITIDQLSTNLKSMLNVTVVDFLDQKLSLNLITPTISGLMKYSII